MDTSPLLHPVASPEDNLTNMVNKKEEVEEVEKVTDSTAKAQHRKMMEAYAKQNPVKYAQKEADLTARLNKL